MYKRGETVAQILDRVPDPEHTVYIGRLLAARATLWRQSQPSRRSRLGVSRVPSGETHPGRNFTGAYPQPL